jgi:hypothetical protein
MASTDPAHDGSDQEVLGSLPSTRPQRRSTKRDQPPRARARPAASASKASPTPKRAARPRPKTAARSRPAPPPPPPVPPAGYATPHPSRPSGTELVMTAMLAVGELVRVGFVAWEQALRSAVRHLPRP